MKSYHKTNKQHRLKLIRVSKKQRKATAIENFTNYLVGKQCLDCGNPDMITFEFDHINKDKTADVSRLVGNGAPWVKILKEIEKCELVCANCHRRRTANRGNWLRLKINAPVV